ncbi:unnamed protein product [Trichogramma brassicae]|uniref:Uncharacterized protein n=1 Tax=Trichogramma brassicae TaxID=86971 RepID=A0A6H5IPF6_9HYME|nr:unnamed protein product [Trichogramma brassicae]
MMSGDEFDVYFGNGGADGQYDFDSEIANHLKIISNLRKLKTMRELVIQDMEENRGDLFEKLYPFFKGWEGQYPDLRKMFSRKEIEWLLTEYVLDGECRVVLSFVIGSGYRDKPELDDDGKPLFSRSTPLHRVTDRFTAGELFKIYNRFDVNYIDERGLTHFHVACKYECYDAVKEFLNLGQDPNFLAPKSLESQKKEDEEESVYPPLHTALYWGSKMVVEVLLNRGANPNLSNAEGLTPLHAIGRRRNDEDGSAELFFKINDEKNQTVQIDARDRLGDTPLHSALDKYVHRSLPELLLRRGANPNSTNGEGMTPLHFICKDRYEAAPELAELFFNVNDDIQQSVQVNAQDNLGRTPLQLAVANLLPRVVDVLLDHGADLSSFTFPCVSLFEESLNNSTNYHKLRLACEALTIVERLEKRGYELDRRDALRIMAVFSKLDLFKKTTELEDSLYDDGEFVKKAKELMMKPNLSLYDLIRLRPKNTKKLLPYTDYYLEFTRWNKLFTLPVSHRMAYAVHICDIIIRRFCQSWTLTSFLELVRYRLPILCCDMIIEQLTSEELSLEQQNTTTSTIRNNRGQNVVDQGGGCETMLLLCNPHILLHLSDNNRDFCTIRACTRVVNTMQQRSCLRPHAAVELARELYIAALQIALGANRIARTEAHHRSPFRSECSSDRYEYLHTHMLRVYTHMELLQKLRAEFDDLLGDGKSKKRGTRSVLPRHVAENSARSHRSARGSQIAHRSGSRTIAYIGGRIIRELGDAADFSTRAKIDSEALHGARQLLC